MNERNRIRPLFPLTKISNLSEIYGPSTLNIFSDASTRNAGKIKVAAYSVVAVCMDTIVDSVSRIHSGCESDVEELRGVKAALALACRHRYEFPNINIFSDSLYSIENIRDRTSYWVFDPINHTYYTASGNPVKNMEILAECLYLLEDLMRTNNVNLYHIKGHMNVDDNDSKAHKSVVIGANTFYRQNNIPHTLNMDYNLIRYCGAYNGLVDKLSRSLLYRSDVLVNNYRDAVYFELDHDVYFR